MISKLWLLSKRSENIHFLIVFGKIFIQFNSFVYSLHSPELDYLCAILDWRVFSHFDKIVWIFRTAQDKRVVIDRKTDETNRKKSFSLSNILFTPRQRRTTAMRNDWINVFACGYRCGVQLLWLWRRQLLQQSHAIPSVVSGRDKTVIQKQSSAVLPIAHTYHKPIESSSNMCDARFLRFNVRFHIVAFRASE